MDTNQIYFKGLVEYLSWFVDISKSTALDIVSETDLENLDSLFDVELSYYLTKENIDKLKATSISVPFEPASFLLGIGFSPKITELILKHYKSSKNLVRMIKNNPYELLEVESVTFRKIDKIALEVFHFSEDFPPRIESYIVYHLNNVCFKNGHLFVTLEWFLNSKFEVSIPKDRLKDHLKNLILSSKIILEGRKLYPVLHYKAEKESAEILVHLISNNESSNFFKNVNSEDFIKGYEAIQTQNITNGKWKRLKWSESKFELSDEQRQAIRTFIKEKLTIITGLPGTGKTTCIKALVDISKSRDLNICLMAPTGIAAKRMSGVCDHDAHTMHKVLGFDGVSWSRNKKNPLDYDVFIIDEFSMVDQVLLYRFLCALPEKECKIVFTGDHAQLGSVAPGNVLRELINNPIIPNVQLTKIFRQEEASDIVLNAHLINRGKTNLTNTKKDFIFVESTDDANSLNLIVKVVDKLKDSNYQVLSPTYQGTLGVLSINHTLQDILNPIYDNNIFKTDKFNFREDDKIMIVRNDYMNQVYNGEQGILTRINTKKKKLDIYINGKTIEYPFYDAYSTVFMDYCRTVHKAQGQEYDYIIMPWVKEFSIQLQRNLIYTAITRAKKKVFIIGEKEALDKSIKNNRIVKRNTIFSSRVATFLGQLQKEQQ